MRIGDLDQRVTLIRDDNERGVSSRAVKPWASYSTVATVWGNLKPIGAGRETFGGPDYTISRSEYLLTIYARSDVTAKLRALVDNRTFEIASVAYARDTKQFMTLRCVETV